MSNPATRRWSLVYWP